MARGRSRATYFPRTKGHSILPQRSYLYPRSTYAYDEDYVPSYRAPTRFYPGSDYYVADAMSSHATTMSTDTVYDNMDLAAKSRGKDQRLMTQVNAALNPESVPQGSPGKGRVTRAANQRLLSRYFPEASHNCAPKLTIRDLESRSLGSLPEYRKTTHIPVHRSPKVVLDDPVRKVGGGGSLRQWLADGLTKTRTMFRKDGEGLSEFRWLDSPSVGELDFPLDNSDEYGYPYSSYSFDSDKASPETYLYDSLEPDDDIGSELYFTPSEPTGRRKQRASTPRYLHSVKQLRRRRRRRERNRMPSFLRSPSLSDSVSEVGSDYSIDTSDSDSLDDYPLGIESIQRQMQYLPYEPAPPYPTSKLYSDPGSSLPKLSSREVTPYSPRIPELSTSRLTPSAILFNNMVSASRRRALANIPDFSNLSTSNIIFSVDTPLSHRPTTSVPRRLEFELPVTYEIPSSHRPYVGVTPVGEEIASFRPITPLQIETNRGTLDFSKPVVVSLEGGDDFFSKFVNQRKQFRDSILRRLDDGTERTYRTLRPLPSSASYYIAPYRAIDTSRRSPEVQSTHRDREKERAKINNDLPALPRAGRYGPSNPIRAIVSVTPRDPLPTRYSSYDRTRPKELDDDSMALVPVSRSNQSRTYSCERDSDEPTGTLTTLDRIRLKAAIISPNVEIETSKKKKGPKSKYAAAVMRELRLNPKKSEGGGSSSGSGGGQPSALRQRLRKVLCKSHNDPTYYKD